MQYVYIDFQDGDGFTDITHLVKHDTLTITTRAFSDNWHYAQNQASFTVIYDPVIYQKFRTISKEAVIRILGVDSAHINTELLQRLITESGFYLMTELDHVSPVFYGRVPPTKSRTYNGKIDITMFKVEALDELNLLKKKIGDICYRNFYIMNPDDKAHSIVHQLSYRAGLSDSQIDNRIAIMDQVEALAPASEDDLVLDVLDALLFEYGYTLNMDTAGRIAPLQWMRAGQPVTHTFDEANIINEISISDAVRQYEGAEVTYYELGEAVTTSGNVNMLLYQDSNLPYDNQGNFAGYPIPAGFKYPPRTNVIDETTGSGQIVYQEYDDKALKYWTNDAIVKRLDYNYKAFESDYSGIVATSGWYMEYRADAGVNLITQVFENRKAEIVFENTSGDFANLYYLNIYGRVLYKTRERIAKIENFEGATEIDRYASTFLFDKDYADRLAKYLAAQHAVGNTYYEFQCAGDEPIAQLTRIVLDEGTDVDGMIVERVYEERTGLFTYKVRQYTREELPALTYQEVREVPNVTSKLVGQNLTGSSGNPAPILGSKYLGRYEAANPVAYNNGDWWTVYDTDDSPIQRGVWWNNNGTLERITAVSAPTLQAKFGEALTDVAWAEANNYGVSSNYGIENLFQSLGAVTAFINRIFTNLVEVQAGGAIYSGYSADGMTPPVSGAGFWLGANGELKALNGEFYGSLGSPDKKVLLQLAQFDGSTIAPGLVFSTASLGSPTNNQIGLFYGRDFIQQRVYKSATGYWDYTGNYLRLPNNTIVMDAASQASSGAYSGQFLIQPRAINPAVGRYITSVRTTGGYQKWLGDRLPSDDWFDKGYIRALNDNNYVGDGVGDAWFNGHRGAYVDVSAYSKAPIHRWYDDEYALTTSWQNVWTFTYQGVRALEFTIRFNIAPAVRTVITTIAAFTATPVSNDTFVVETDPLARYGTLIQFANVSSLWRLQVRRTASAPTKAYITVRGISNLE